MLCAAQIGVENLYAVFRDDIEFLLTRASAFYGRISFVCVSFNGFNEEIERAICIFIGRVVVGGKSGWMRLDDHHLLFVGWGERHGSFVGVIISERRDCATVTRAQMNRNVVDDFILCADVHNDTVCQICLSNACAVLVERSQID